MGRKSVSPQPRIRRHSAAGCRMLRFRLSSPIIAVRNAAGRDGRRRCAGTMRWSTTRRSRLAIRTSLAYGLVSALWILFSDGALAAMVHDPRLFLILETIKGWSFVAVTAVLLYIALRKQLARWEAGSVERGQAEAALEIRDQRLRLATEATRDGLWERDVLSGRTYFSPAYWRMLGYEPDELEPVYQAWVDLLHQDDRERAVAAGVDCIENRTESFEIEYRMLAKGGDWRWILARGKAERRDERGRALILVGTHQDITERKPSEAERIAFETQLHQAQKMEAIGQLAGEWRTISTICWR